MKFSACKYSFFCTCKRLPLPASKYDRKKKKKSWKHFFQCISFLMRVGVASCLQTVQKVVNRGLTIAMKQIKDTHVFRLALFIVCSNGDCYVNIYLAKNIS